MQILGLILILVAIYVIGIDSSSFLGAVSGIVGLAILIKVKRDRRNL
jgi:hypothetical protein